ncbi:LEAF RUST 10 DISEASE-RESISTANCE LOCUS RECEPTOR-LIKE PROTEIN KINASE-like 2.4 [Humulus lupulus]|uniref:LEAF RUST 10 DISEASE-RESISTANCE LOCUS RECEPTOR-LIKE PROTEIN KINASE-like 2.4 n=1 Tax=Humulus lupulus TaxID=3486 RepID=UPI002B40C176|nr:LEAF RUST 10 DISEASE-RESISTANCE LOCUS RECEPTOR-LIKE PROTEIN KINASE-like 2.4 [Humulus lupulus]
METRGTIGYIAPEFFNRTFGGVSHKLDVYSYGMLILEMVGGRKNFDSGVSRASKLYYPNWIYKNSKLDNIDFGIMGVTTEDEKEISVNMILVAIWYIQTSQLDCPSMSKVVEMLNASLQSLEIPPKPFLVSPTTSP